jgi:phosphoribosylpyrophosphate synthetase
MHMVDVEPKEILLVDDVVTRGATIVGAANKLHDAFPGARIRAFAAMRTISPPQTFSQIVCPCVGKIMLNGQDTRRRP